MWHLCSRVTGTSMWVFTELADGWDRLREQDGRFLDEQWTSWAQYANAHADDPGFFPAIRNMAVYGGLGATYATWTLSTSVATGFIDTLRLGDGIHKGGWGYAQDAVRLMVVAAPALRLGRLALSTVANVDAFSSTGTCAWVAAAKALRLTGTKHFATIEDLAKAAGVTAPNFSGITTLAPVAKIIQQLGGVTKPLAVAAGKAETVIDQAVAANPNAVILFAVKWMQGGKWVGHAMVAARILGRTMIVDRAQFKVVSRLAELNYAQIGTATVTDLLAVENATLATIVDRLGTAAVAANAAVHSSATTDFTPLVANLGLEVRSVPFRIVRSIPGRNPTQRPPQGVPGTGTRTTTTCSDEERRVGMTDGGVATISRRWCGSVTVDYKVYVVKVGDYLARIAKSVYGDENKWRLVYKANQGKLGPNPNDPSALVPGMQLEIPFATSQRVWDEPIPQLR